MPLTIAYNKSIGYYGCYQHDKEGYRIARHGEIKGPKGSREEIVYADYAYEGSYNAIKIIGHNTGHQYYRKGIYHGYIVIHDKELMEYGVKLGADVPYCIMGGTALSEGIGEILTPVNHLKGVKVVIATPNVSVSTPWAYKSLVLDEKTVHPDTEIMLEAVANNDIDKLAKNAYNVLETVVAKEYKEIGALEEMMCEKGALGSIMSGSGPTVFGIFDDEEKAESACKEIKEKNHCRCCYLTEFI